MVRALSESREGPNLRAGITGSIDKMPNPDDLRALGERLDEARRLNEPRPRQAPPTSAGIAFRFATELIVAVAFGGGLGWVLDRWLGTKPIFLLAMLVLGAAAGIYNVMRAAADINARTTGTSPAPLNDDDEET
jgi:ATP synthase protein I